MGERGHGHRRGHGHGHSHSHPVSSMTDGRALVATLVLLSAFMAFEVTVAIVSHSVALLSDAGHMLADVGAIAGSFVAMRLAARPVSGSHTYRLDAGRDPGGSRQRHHLVAGGRADHLRSGASACSIPSTSTGGR